MSDVHQATTEGLIKRAKVNELERDWRRFAGGPLARILDMVYHQNARVYISKHFPERMVDRKFTKRDDRLFLFKLLSFVFEKRGEVLLKDQDVFVRYKDIMVHIFSELRNGVQQIRLNTFICNNEDAWIKPKNGRPVQTVDVTMSDLSDYIPITLKH